MKVYRETVGLAIKINVGFDISSCEVIKILYEKPDGTKGSWDGQVVDQTKVGYVTANTGDLDMGGTWKLQPYLECGTQRLYGETKTLTVYEHL